MKPIAGAAVAVASLAVFLTAAGTGGVGSPALFFAPLLPLLGGFLLGTRGTVFATAAGVLGTGVLWAFAGGPGPAGETAAWWPVVGLALAVVSAGVLRVQSGRRVADDERRWRQRQSLYRKVFEQSKEVVGVTTPQGRMVDINPAGVEFYGYDSKEVLLARSVEEFYSHPEERRELLRRLGDRDYVEGFVTRHRTRDGDDRLVAGTTSTLRDDEGEIEYLVTILRDVTEQRAAEAERERILAELAEKNTDMERFTYTVSHDLKSPMTAIYGFLRILDRDIKAGNSARIEHNLATIRAQVDRMKHLTDDLLDLARIGLGEVSREDISVVEVAGEAVSLVGSHLMGQGVIIEVDPNLPRVRADRTLLRLVLQNLIENGIKFCAESTDPRIHVGCRGQGEDTAFFVADNGVGIAREDRQRVFDLFEKLSSDVSGTGIGLANVKRAVEAHGGRVWVESDSEGPGSTFFFTLPDARPGTLPSTAADQEP